MWEPPNVCTTSTAASTMNPEYQPFKSRRARLLSEMAQAGGGVAIVPTAPEVVRNRDSHYPYRFDSYFWYLTGFPEPEAVVVLAVDAGGLSRELLFCRDKNEEREIWEGFRHGPALAAESFGFDEAHLIDSLDEKLATLLENQANVFFAFGAAPEWDARLSKALAAVRAQARAGKSAPEAIHDLRARLDRMRLIKDAHEITCLQRAADIATAAHTRAMKFCRPGQMEYEIEAEFLHEFRRSGADAPSYGTIVAGGANACCLHYHENRALLRDGDLLLIDAGCEVEGYASDITRTFPVNGRFSPAQRDVYQIVLAAQQAAIDAVKPGVDFMAPHEAALAVLTQGLLDLKLINDDGGLAGALERGDYKRFYMHRTSHWLGLDVHDAGEYRRGEQWTTLRDGMVLTVEPGLYLRAGDGVPAELAGIGVRIEDDVLVTDEGARVLTSPAKTVSDIEALMRTD